MSRGRASAAATLLTLTAAAAGAAAPGAAAAATPEARAAAPTRTQVFFRDRLLADRRTSAAVRRLLVAGGGFVHRRVLFEDLTGDGRDDAVIRVHTGGADGAIALYVFSTDHRRGEGLRAVHRAQRLRRATARVRGTALLHRSAVPAGGDDPCCPSRVVETELRWDDARGRFRVAARRDVEPA